MPRVFFFVVAMMGSVAAASREGLRSSWQFNFWGLSMVFAASIFVLVGHVDGLSVVRKNWLGNLLGIRGLSRHRLVTSLEIIPASSRGNAFPDKHDRDPRHGETCNCDNHNPVLDRTAFPIFHCEEAHG